MSVCEERKQGAPVDTPASPGFSCVSVKSNRSMFEPPHLSDVDAQSNISRIQLCVYEDYVDAQRATSPGFSCVSVKSNRSMFEPPHLSDVDAQRATSPGFSCVSMKSNRSMFEPLISVMLMLREQHLQDSAVCL
ncbi:hypothetical protein G5714_002969 [Onychostoma macrolepis]|uniref:Uncharacterized protein n=1 Tax=Onychostoma macrolepis TaxID=369639 RepID=A0A7J6D894_9TELE|nr:hypothetical protein G5714_002969 [Onychostoma macrolepis]